MSQTKILGSEISQLLKSKIREISVLLIKAFEIA